VKSCVTHLRPLELTPGSQEFVLLQMSHGLRLFFDIGGVSYKQVESALSVSRTRESLSGNQQV
jgi:hypothetical protein